MPSAHSQHKGNHKGGAAEGRPPFVEAAEGRLLCVGCEHWAYLSVEMQDMCLVESQDICLVEMLDMCCVKPEFRWALFTFWLLLGAFLETF